MVWDVAQVEDLPNMSKAQGLVPSTTKEKEKRGKKPIKKLNMSAL